MAQKVLSWNVRDGLGDAERAAPITEFVLGAQPDVAFFPEAAHEDMLDSDTFLDAVDLLRKDGYESYYFPYNDIDGRTDRHGFLAIGRNVITAWAMSMGGRRAANVRVLDTESDTYIRFFGAHLDDRLEQTRLAQVTHLLGHYGMTADPTVVAGDLNSMHYQDSRTRKLRNFAPLADKMPVLDPGRWNQLTAAQKVLHIPGRIGSLATRLTGMAAGTTLQRFAEAGFTDADRAYCGTKGSYQLDHVLYTSELEVVSPLRIHEHKGLSDHSAIMVGVGVA